MLERIRTIAQIGAALAVALFFLVATWVVWQARAIPLHVNGVLTRFEGVESKLNATAINMDKATAAWASSAKDQAGAVTDLATDAHGTLSELDQSIEGIQPLLLSAKGTTDAATATLGALADDERALKPSLDATEPLIAAYTSTGNDLDALLKRKALADFADNLGPLSGNLVAITGTGAHMLATGDAVETKATQSYLHPSRNPLVRTWQAASPFIVAGAKITATVF